MTRRNGTQRMRASWLTGQACGWWHAGGATHRNGMRARDSLQCNARGQADSPDRHAGGGACGRV